MSSANYTLNEAVSVFGMMLARELCMSKKRVMAKAKVYGFSPWVDQLNAINQIMKDTGERHESAILRKLVDEALDARRGKSHPFDEESDSTGVRLETIESLMMRIVRQGDMSLRIEDVCLALIQDVLAEAFATRRLVWESLVMPQLRDAGIDANELERRFVRQLNSGKVFAYSLAERIKESQESSENTLTLQPNAAGADAAEACNGLPIEPAKNYLQHAKKCTKSGAVVAPLPGNRE